MSKTIKCICVGDGYVGKTCLLARLANRELDENYIATIFDDAAIEVKYKEKSYSITLIDTAGQEAYQALRKQFYTDVDVFLVCFSVDSDDSFRNVQTCWLPEIQEYCERYILVGTKSDLRYGQHGMLIEKRDAEEFAKRHQMQYLECSALRNENIMEIRNAIVENCLEKETKLNGDSSSNSGMSNTSLQFVLHLKRVLCCQTYL